MISGMIIGGAGFGPFIYSFVSTAIVNPDNVPYKNIDGLLVLPQDVADNVPRMYRICLVSWTVLCILGILLVNRNPVF